MLLSPAPHTAVAGPLGSAHSHSPLRAQRHTGQPCGQGAEPMTRRRHHSRCAHSQHIARCLCPEHMCVLSRHVLARAPCQSNSHRRCSKAWYGQSPPKQGSTPLTASTAATTQTAAPQPHLPAICLTSLALRGRVSTPSYLCRVVNTILSETRAARHGACVIMCGNKAQAAELRAAMAGVGGGPSKELPTLMPTQEGAHTHTHTTATQP